MLGFLKALFGFGKDERIGRTVTDTKGNTWNIERVEEDNQGKEFYIVNDGDGCGGTLDADQATFE